jgi:UDP-2-acetamido-2,6-beta-L-arabino-hexul-4-ose reductase
MSGERIQAVHMLSGYTHSITDPSDTEDLVTAMWANETFDPPPGQPLRARVGRWHAS